MQSIKTHKHKPRQLVHVHTHTHTHTHYQEDFFSPLYSIYSFLHTESQYTIQLPTEYTGLYKYKDTYVHTHSCMGIYIQCQEMIFHLPLTCDNTWGAQIPLLKAVSWAFTCYVRSSRDLRIFWMFHTCFWAAEKWARISPFTNQVNTSRKTTLSSD